MLFPFLKSNLFLKDKVIITNVVISLALWLFSISWLYFQIQPQVEPVALRYTIYFGIDLIGPWWYIYLIPLIGLIILILNYTLAYLIYLNVKIIACLLALTATLCQFLLAITSILIVLLNK